VKAAFYCIYIAAVRMSDQFCR